MSTFADHVIAFNKALRLDAQLPQGVSVMNPFRESDLAVRISTAFYRKYYADNRPRHIILGINPGRFGAALSGVPFTDFKRLEQFCGISSQGHTSHELSSEFVYAMITAQGTVSEFYERFYINSVCPLGFVVANKRGRSVNYNYYDSESLITAVRPFIIESIRAQIRLGCCTDLCFCMGKKNGEFLLRLNEDQHFFDRIVVLPHPRFIMQYRRKAMAEAIAEYASALQQAKKQG